ncbi:uncharacterized protein BDZ99DRAFT_46324 [Mytilinidion resinicola]|uniref:Uncharacterized protein n=1 Tax=Mytilinidion resinicola TaxID=574789 RepID=A0A6A6YKT0_9PEZI|nr:uncharacterized protein BDZ99DRAFT_46324 [Mytilinidion resinicola]KAF2809159.1 hypothetical protein BDZ99DRAFT_46324 [Mytilinidion resinicola]
MPILVTKFGEVSLACNIVIPLTIASRISKGRLANISRMQSLRLQHYNLGSTTHMPESYSPNISCREPS